MVTFFIRGTMIHCINYASNKFSVVILCLVDTFFEIRRQWDTSKLLSRALMIVYNVCVQNSRCLNGSNTSEHITHPSTGIKSSHFNIFPTLKWFFFLPFFTLFNFFQPYWISYGDARKPLYNSLTELKQ